MCHPCRLAAGGMTSDLGRSDSEKEDNFWDIFSLKTGHHARCPVFFKSGEN